MPRSVLPQPAPPQMSVGRPLGSPPAVISSRPWMPVGHFSMPVNVVGARSMVLLRFTFVRRSLRARIARGLSRLREQVVHFALQLEHAVFATEVERLPAFELFELGA